MKTIIQRKKTTQRNELLEGKFQALMEVKAPFSKKQKHLTLKKNQLVKEVFEKHFERNSKRR